MCAQCRAAWGALRDSLARCPLCRCVIESVRDQLSVAGADDWPFEDLIAPMIAHVRTEHGDGPADAMLRLNAALGDLGDGPAQGGAR